MILFVAIFQIGIAKPINHIITYLIGNDLLIKNPTDTFLMSLGAIILAPILEELIFRGIILKGFLSRYSYKKAILFSAIVFGAIHVKPLQIWGAILLGLFLGWVYYKTKNIGAVIVSHFFANFSILLQSYFYYTFIDSSKIIFIDAIFVPISILILIALLQRLLKKMKKNAPDHSLEYEI